MLFNFLFYCSKITVFLFVCLFVCFFKQVSSKSKYYTCDENVGYRSFVCALIRLHFYIKILCVLFFLKTNSKSLVFYLFMRRVYLFIQSFVLFILFIFIK